MSRRAWLWVAFFVVHVLVSVLGWIEPNEPMGDVYLVYEKWSSAFLNGGTYSYTDSLKGVTVSQYVGYVGLDVSWVYPQLALVPMLLTWLLGWVIGYTPAWAVMVTALDAAAFAVLIGRGRAAGRTLAGAFWLAFILLLGPVALYRIDAITVPLGILGCLWLIGRPWLGSVLLAVATWMKVWPAALLAAAVIAVRRRAAIVGGALVVSALTLGTVILLGGGSYAFGFISDQAGRDLQVEAPVSTFYLWDYMLDGSSATFYDPDLLTFEIYGPYVNTVIPIMTPLLAVVVLAVAALGAYKAWRKASFVSLFPPLALALVTAFIAFNKVGSPQYIVWISVPLILGLTLDRRRWVKPAILALGICLTTQIIYPLTYYDLLKAFPFPVVVITIRNALMIALFVWSTVLVARTRVRHRRSVGGLAEPAPESVLTGGL
ncbi:MAG: glycosyltransferase family 87 protein [Microbacterium sp.]|uniref:glycosyltransferase family 87 protein n=1 Tax=Microbacterium sp. TaxID=51671 RepID=UPI0039E3AB8D